MNARRPPRRMIASMLASIVTRAGVLRVLSLWGLSLCLVAAAQTGDIREDALRLEDIVAMIGSFQALEVPLPEGVQSVYLAQARGDELGGLSGISFTGTEPAPERLRVVVGFPRAQSPFCGEGLLTLLARIDGMSTGSLTESCYETPEGYTGGGWHSVGADAQVALGQWTPLFVYRPSVWHNPGGAQEGLADADAESWLLVLLYAGDAPLEGVGPPSPPDLGGLRRDLHLP